MCLYSNYMYMTELRDEASERYQPLELIARSCSSSDEVLLVETVFAGDVVVQVDLPLRSECTVRTVELR